MPGPVEDAALQDDLIAIGRLSVLAAHERLLKLRNGPGWEYFQKVKHLELEYSRSIGLRVGDSTVDDFSAEDAILETLKHEGERRGLQVLTREEMLRPVRTGKNGGGHVMAVLGEEYMKVENNPAWKGVERLRRDCDLLALVDPLDGTVLRQRDLPNWCIALVFYTRREGEVLASLVVQAIGDLYFATRAGGAFRQSLDPMRPVDGGRLVLGEPKPIRSDSLTPEKHLSFVAQRPKSFLRMASYSKVLAVFDRVYNLGGNPMLAKLADGTMSAVFEPKGHKAHDVVPGAFIARMAGAAVRDLRGRELDWRQALRNPDHRDGAGLLSYVAAINDDLARRIVESLPRGKR